MNWRVKGIIQKVLSSLPGGMWVNDHLQTSVGQLRNFEKILDAKVVDDWRVLVRRVRELDVRLEGLDILEIGTGWFPTLPFCFHLAGVRSCRTFDLTRHINSEQSFHALRCIEKHCPTIAEVSGQNLEAVQNRHRNLLAASSIDDLLRRAGIQYFAPADATRTGLPEACLDMVYSNSVMEHVPGPVIVEMMKESRRILRPGGLSVHSVACNDHYAHFDKSITFINYLQYTDSQWKLWNCSLNYQNRLRAPEFLGFAQQAGLEVVLKKSHPRPELLAILPKMKIAPEFSHFTPEDLCTMSIDFAARKN